MSSRNNRLSRVARRGYANDALSPHWRNGEFIDGPITSSASWAPPAAFDLPDAPENDSGADNSVVIGLQCSCGRTHEVSIPRSWSRRRVERFLTERYGVYENDLREMLRGWPEGDLS